MPKRLVSLAFFILALTTTVFADQSRQDLGINGCSVRDAATAYQGDSSLLTFVACAGPLGLFVSTDFGGAWSFAGGGVYLSGEAFGVAATSFGVYALRSNNTLIRSNLDSPGSFTPSWENVNLSLSVGESLVTLVGLESKESFVIFGTSTDGTPAIRVLNTETNDLIPAAQLPVAGQLLHFAVIGTNIFTVRKDQGDIDGPNSLYRAPFDASTGEIGDWSDITSNVTELLSGEFASAFVDGVYEGSDDAVFVRVSRVDALKQVYRSIDSGDTFSFSFPIGGSEGNIQGEKYYAPGNFTRACSFGATTIINSLISRDNGATWARLKPFISEGFNLFDEDLCLFDPRDTSGNSALVRVVEGFSKTNNLLFSSPSWTSANAGLQGIIVKGMSRVKESEQDTVAAVTNVGLAITKNFSASNRSWLFPTCTGRKTCWNDSIALARGNPNIVFAGTEDMERGYITADLGGNLSVAWDILLDNPSGATDAEDLPVTLQFRTFSEIPSRVFGLYQWVNPSTNIASGGIYSFTYSDDSGDPSVGEKPVILGGKSINDLIALNATTLYASANYTGSNFTVPAPKPVYRLTIAEDGTVSEQVDSSGELGGSPGVSVFAYDNSTDTLYAAAQGNSFYILSQASTGSTTWTRGGTIGPVTAMTIGQNGDIFVSRLNELYRSSDGGQSWERIFLGLNDEQFRTIAVTEEIPASAPARINKAVSALAASPSRLVVGSSTGLNQLTAGAEPTATPTPSPTATPRPQRIPSTCSLSVENRCASLRSRTRCRFAATLNRKSDNAPLAGRVLALQKKESNSWRELVNMTTKSNGRAFARATVRRSDVLRARIATTTVACTTSQVRIR